MEGDIGMKGGGKGANLDQLKGEGKGMRGNSEPEFLLGEVFPLRPDVREKECRVATVSLREKECHVAAVSLHNFLHRHLFPLRPDGMRQSWPFPVRLRWLLPAHLLWLLLV